MNEHDLKKLKMLIVNVADYYSKELKPAVITMMAEDLREFEYENVEAAFSKYRKQDKNFRFPMPAQIREIILQKLDNSSNAREIAAKVLESVSKFGYTSGTEAREYIGEVGWRAVERFGGWLYICQNLGVTIQLTTFNAQIRDLCEATLKSFDAEFIAIEYQKKPLQATDWILSKHK